MSTLVSPSRRLGRRWTPIVALISAAFILLTQVVGVPGRFGAPEAHAQNRIAATCDYRVGGKYANSMCWIDFDFLTDVNVRRQAFSAQGVPVVLTVDPGNRVEFTLKLSTSDNLDHVANIVPKAGSKNYGNSAFAKAIYRNPPGKDPKSLIGRLGRASYSFAVEMSDIRAVDASGAPTGLGMAFMDGEITNSQEETTVTSNVNLRYLGPEVPAAFSEPCPGGEHLNGNTFVCTGADSRRAGTWSVAADNPTNFKTNFKTRSEQNGAWAVYVLNVSGKVTVDRRGVSALGDNTNFSLEARRRNTVVGTARGEDLTGVSLIDIVGSGDEVVFSSVGTGSSTPEARYTPNWTCTMTDPQGVTTNINVTPRDDGWNRSSVSIPITSYGRAHCAVHWVSRYEPTASLKLTKQVGGSAATSSKLAGKRFTIDYQCSLAGFSESFPNFQGMSGSVELTHGRSQSILNIPVGSRCVFTENNAFTDPALSLEKEWTTASGKGVGESATIDVARGENAVMLVNKYENTAGKLVINKRLEGDARGEFKDTPINFKYQCAGDANPTTLIMPAVGDSYRGSVQSEVSIPIERDCAVWEDLSLDEETQKRMTLATTFSSDAGGTTGNDGRFSFRISTTAGDPPSVTVDVLNTTTYRTAPLRIQKNVVGDGRDVAKMDGNRARLFPINWECTTPNNVHRKGTLIGVDGVFITPGQFPVGTTCKVSEHDIDPIANLEAAEPKVIYKGQERSNSDARNGAAFITIEPEDTGDNTVIVENRYTRILGTVSLVKEVVGDFTLRNDVAYRVQYSCGIRPVEDAGQANLREVNLTGTVTLTPGVTTPLQADPSWNLQDNLGGNLGVPLGNTCTFTELDGDILGVEWTYDVSSVRGSTVANKQMKLTETDNVVKIQNTLNSTGGGLSIAKQWNDEHGVAPDFVDVNVRCVDTDPQNVSNNHTIEHEIRINRGDTAVRRFSAGEVPAGWHCEVIESADPLERTGASGNFTIGREVVITANGEEKARSDGAAEVRSSSFDVPTDGAAVTLVNTYTLPMATVKVKKNVAVAADSTNLVPNLAEKENQNFSFTLRCTLPTGRPQMVTLTTSARNADGAGTTVPAGSLCSVSESQSPPEANIKLEVTSEVNGANTVGVPDEHSQTGAAPIAFVVGQHGAEYTAHFINTYSREKATIRIQKTLMAPGADGLAGIRAANGGRFTFDVVCDGETYSATAAIDPLDNGAVAEATVADVPVGATCRVAETNAAPITVSNSVQTTDGEKTSEARMSVVSTWKVKENQEVEIAQNFGDQARPNTSQDFVVSSDAVAGNPNLVTVKNDYRYDNTRVRMRKVVVINDKDKELLDAAGPARYTFTYVCTGPDFSRISSSSPLNGMFTEATLGSDITYVRQGSGKNIYAYAPDPSDAVVPIGTICDVQEVKPANTPASLRHTVSGGENGAFIAVADGNEDVTANGAATRVNTFTITNTYERANTKVAAYHYKYGSAAEMGIGESFSFNYECTLDGQPVRSGTYQFNNEQIGRGVQIRPDGTIQPVNAAGEAVDQRREFTAPAGSICTVVQDYSTIPAYAVLAPTGKSTKDRTPMTNFVGRSNVDKRFAIYVDQGNQTSQPAEGTSPTSTDLVNTAGDQLNVDLSESNLQDVYKARQRRFTFEVPAPSSTDSEYGYELVTSNIYIRDLKDVKLTKEALGAPAGSDDHEYIFDYECAGSTGTERIRNGETLTIPNVPVREWCGISERAAGYAIDGLYPRIRWTLDNPNDSRLRWFSYEDDTHPEDPPLPSGVLDQEKNRVVFQVEAVGDPADVNPDSKDWAFKVTNHYPSIKVKKTIAGALVSENGTAPFDTAVIETGTNTMTINYRVTNPSNNRLSDLVLKDPSLVGGNFTLATPGRRPMTIDPDGTLRGLECATFMEPGQEFDCAVVVTINSDIDAPFAYRGEVTVTAASGAGTVRDSDSFGALRLPRAAFLLPNTGTKAMVWVLGIGLLVLLAALWNYLRRRGEDDDNS